MKKYTVLDVVGLPTGFYQDAVHGQRRLTIPDPAYVRRQIEVDQLVEKIMMVTEDGVETQVPVQVIEKVLVDDPTDIPPLIDAGPNPDTKIPSDAIEITEEQYQALIGNRGGGPRKVVMIGGVATVEPYAPPPPPLADVQAAAEAAIDAAAGRARARYITVAQGQEGVYLLKAAEADAYVAAGRPADTTAYPLLTAEAQARGVTVPALADLVRLLRDQWVQIAAQIEAARIAGKGAVKLSTTNPAVEVARTTAIVALETMRP